MSDLVGLIPAHAGKTQRPHRRHHPLSAHPRSRGENVGGRARECCAEGSSPLTRGKLPFGFRRKPFFRLIPAHAGKTLRGGASRCGRRAHPRSRGENDVHGAVGEGVGGSSPLTRGKRGGGGQATPNGRLIPAHAGKTPPDNTSAPHLGAHPRSRGENVPECGEVGAGRGSSPLTRGKRLGDVQELLKLRLIPAHAGKTHLRLRAGRHTPAHPRSRGENEWCVSRRPSASGSSPLTRGKLELDGLQVIAEGLIPAHAGKTLPDLRFYCADRSDLGNP